jgi:cell division protein FtsQ
MDGRRRLAEPGTDTVFARSIAGVLSASGSVLSVIGRTRLVRAMRARLTGPDRYHIPPGAGIVTAVAFVLAAIAFGAVRGGHLPEITAQARDMRDGVANSLGFRITSVALSGAHHLSREDILAIAGITERTSLLFLDASDVRSRLKANPWIAEATVLKLYPGRLHIAVTEREAFALWQKSGAVTVISADGTELEPYRADFAGLPLVVGVGAQLRAREFLALLTGYPLVRDGLRAAVLVAERRWNVVLRNGIEVQLPEADPEQALKLLVKLDRDDKLLSRDITAIDLRLADRVTVRLSDEAVSARAAAQKDLKAKKKGSSA